MTGCTQGTIVSHHLLNVKQLAHPLQLKLCLHKLCLVF